MNKFFNTHAATWREAKAFLKGARVVVRLLYFARKRPLRRLSERPRIIIRVVAALLVMIGNMIFFAVFAQDGEKAKAVAAWNDLLNALRHALSAFRVLLDALQALDDLSDDSE